MLHVQLEAGPAPRRDCRGNEEVPVSESRREICHDGALRLYQDGTLEVRRLVATRVSQIVFGRQRLATSTRNLPVGLFNDAEYSIGFTTLRPGAWNDSSQRRHYGSRECEGRFFWRRAARRRLPLRSTPAKQFPGAGDRFRRSGVRANDDCTVVQVVFTGLAARLSLFSSSK